MHRPSRGSSGLCWRPAVNSTLLLCFTVELILYRPHNQATDTVNRSFSGPQRRERLLNNGKAFLSGASYSTHQCSVSRMQVTLLPGRGSMCFPDRTHREKKLLVLVCVLSVGLFLSLVTAGVFYKQSESQALLCLFCFVVVLSVVKSKLTQAFLCGSGCRTN